MIGCGVTGCGFGYEVPGVMAAHLVLDHESLPSVALIRARQLFGFDTVAPPRAPGVAYRQSAIAIAPREIRPTARFERSCRLCDRVAPHRCRRHGEPPAASGDTLRRLHRRADAATCLVCAKTRVTYGTPCKRHGGPPRGTAWYQRAAAQPSEVVTM